MKRIAAVLCGVVLACVPKSGGDVVCLPAGHGFVSAQVANGGGVFITTVNGVYEGTPATYHIRGSDGVTVRMTIAEHGALGCGGARAANQP